MAACGRCKKDLAMVAAVKFHLSTNMLLSDPRHRMKNTDLKVIDVLEMVTLTHWMEIIGEYPAPMFLLILMTRPLNGLCFKCKSLDKSYNWSLLNRLILRFWPLGLRHGSDWLVSLLWRQYILITFVDTLTNSLHETRPTELAVLSPFKSDRSYFFAHIRNLIQNGKVHFFGDQYFLITLGDSH